jgi:AcrR family transcriptional regulator
MARPYTLKRRGEQQAETRKRIVEATVDLHTEVGPAHTSISMIAERAGVQRHTVYAHFADERSLLAACSGLVAERDPLPDASAFRSIQDHQARLRAGIGALYAWYERNRQLMASVMRDAEHHAATREVATLHFGPPMAALNEVLGAGLDSYQRTLLHVALSFFTWRTLTAEVGLGQKAAVSAMVQAIAG